MINIPNWHDVVRHSIAHSAFTAAGILFSSTFLVSTFNDESLQNQIQTFRRPPARKECRLWNPKARRLLSWLEQIEVHYREDNVQYCHNLCYYLQVMLTSPRLRSSILSSECLRTTLRMDRKPKLFPKEHAPPRNRLAKFIFQDSFEIGAVLSNTLEISENSIGLLAPLGFRNFLFVHSRKHVHVQEVASRERELFCVSAVRCFAMHVKSH